MSNSEKIVTTPLKDILITRKGKKPKVLIKTNDKGYLPYIDIKAFEKNEYRQFAQKESGVYCQDGEMVMVWDGARAGLVGTTPEGVLGSTLMRIEIPLVHHKLVRYFFESKYHDINTHTKGVGIPHVNPHYLGEIEFPIFDLNTAEKLLDKIEGLFSDIDAGTKALQRVEKNLKRYRASVLKAACQGKLVSTEAELAKADGREYEHAGVLLERILKERKKKWEKENPGKKYKEPKAVDTKDLPELPEGWIWTNIDQLIIDGPQNGIYLPKTKYGRGMPILRIDDYQENFSRISTELQKVRASDSECSTYELECGDLVINRVNSLTHLGKSLVIKDKHLPAIFESNMMRAGFSSVVISEWVNYYLRSGHGKAKLLKNAKWAVNQASINQSDVKVTTVPLPPIHELTRVIGAIETNLTLVDKTNILISSRIKSISILKQSVLKNAFEGRLVPQDPNDEPVSVLLEKIKTERKKCEEEVKAQKTKRSNSTKKPKKK